MNTQVARQLRGSRTAPVCLGSTFHSDSRTGLRQRRLRNVAVTRVIWQLAAGVQALACVAALEYRL